MDTLTVHRQLSKFFLNGLLFIQSCLLYVEQSRPNHHVRIFENALDKCKSRIAVQRRPNKGRCLGMAVEQHVLPGNQDVVEDDQCINLVKAV